MHACGLLLAEEESKEIARGLQIQIGSSEVPKNRC